MSEADVIQEARARLVAAFPDWTDATDDPHPQGEGKLPAFAVSLTMGNPERVAMGGGWDREGTLSVSLRAAVARSAPARQVMHEHRATALAALLAAPADLDGRVWDIAPAGGDIDADPQNARFWQIDADLLVTLTD